MSAGKHFKTSLILSYSITFATICFTGAVILAANAEIISYSILFIGTYLLISTSVSVGLVLLLNMATELTKTVQYAIMMIVYLLFLELWSENSLWAILTDWNQVTPFQGAVHAAFLVSAIVSYLPQTKKID
ncbi:MAG: hypothetical protein U0289_05560 [Cyclobacteriaceae bacterium]|jgi:hypothetical protein|nr:hypothetical protein [Cytophagales bacterium]HNP78587.1 hypothetical protein [Cyclobacteriaceae bacterium]